MLAGLGAAAALLVAACTDLNPLQMTIDRVIVLKPGEWGDRALVGVVVEFHNRGKEPVHVAYASIHAIDEQNERQNMVVFRKDLELRLRQATETQSGEAARKILARIGVDPAMLQDVKTEALEIGSGERVKKIYAFGFSKPPQNLALELLYHDNATDKMFKLRSDHQVN
jgi:hypothetical protein